MLIRVFDTETTGLFTRDQPADDPAGPRLASISWIDTDESLRFEKPFHAYILPDRWEMPAEASAINRLTTSSLKALGQPIAPILEAYTAGIRDNDAIMVGYNVAYDLKIMRGELRRAGMDDLYRATRSTCVMKMMQRLMHRGRWPRLAEACQYASIPLVDAHTAADDVQATLQLLRVLKAHALCEWQPRKHTTYGAGTGDISCAQSGELHKITVDNSKEKSPAIDRG